MADYLRDIIKGVVDRTDWAGNGYDVPFFFSGTPMAVSKELDMIKDQASKFPMIYLFERISEREGTYLDPISLSANVNMLFMTVADVQDWSIDDHYTNACDLMRDYATLFKNTLFSDRRRFYQDEAIATFAGEPNFGKYINNKGYTGHIFNDDMSGCSLSFEINIKESLNFCS